MTNKCLRCGYEWWPRGNWRAKNYTAKRCAKCRTPYWNRPYKYDMSRSGLLHSQSSFKLTFKPKRYIAEQFSLFKPSHKSAGQKKQFSGVAAVCAAKSERDTVALRASPHRVSLSKRVKRPARLVLVKGKKRKATKGKICQE